MEVEVKSLLREVTHYNGIRGYYLYGNDETCLLMVNVKGWPFPKYVTVPTKDVKFIRSVKQFITIDEDEALL